MFLNLVCSRRQVKNQFFQKRNHTQTRAFFHVLPEKHVTDYMWSAWKSCWDKNRGFVWQLRHFFPWTWWKIKLLKMQDLEEPRFDWYLFQNAMSKHSHVLKCWDFSIGILKYTTQPTTKALAHNARQKLDSVFYSFIHLQLYSLL